MAPRWTVMDLVLIVLGALGGSLLAGAAASLADAPAETVPLATFGGPYVGTPGGTWGIAPTPRLGPESLGFDIQPTGRTYPGTGPAPHLAIAILFAPLQQLLLPDQGPSQEVAEIFAALQGFGPRLAMVAVSTLLAPLSEELMFRGVLL